MICHHHSVYDLLHQTLLNHQHDLDVFLSHHHYYDNLCHNHRGHYHHLHHLHHAYDSAHDHYHLLHHHHHDVYDHHNHLLLLFHDRHDHRIPYHSLFHVHHYNRLLKILQYVGLEVLSDLYPLGCIDLYAQDLV